MDLFFSLAAVVPLMVYFVFLTLIHLRRRPTILSGQTDALFLALGLSGFFMVGIGPAVIPIQSLVNNGQYSWILLFFLYILSVFLAASTLSRKIVIYNLESERVKETIVKRWGEDWSRSPVDFGLPNAEIDFEDLSFDADIDADIRHVLTLSKTETNAKENRVEQNGIGAVTDGIGAVTDETGAVTGGTGAVIGGIGAVTGGTGAVADGIGAVTGEIGAVTDETGAVADGIGAVTGGTGAVTGGTGAVTDGTGADSSVTGNGPSLAAMEISWVTDDVLFLKTSRITAHMTFFPRMKNTTLTLLGKPPMPEEWKRFQKEIGAIFKPVRTSRSRTAAFLFAILALLSGLIMIG